MMTYLKQMRTVLPGLILSGSLLVLFILQIHNVLKYPAIRGFDALGHIEYIEYLKLNRRIPLPHEGWELYQPPMYYLLAILLPTTIMVQLLGLVFWGIIVLVTGIAASKWFKSRKIGLYLAVLIGSVPVLIYQTPNVSNELLSTLSIGLLLGITIRLIYSPAQKYGWGWWTLIAALAVLTKATAFVTLGMSVVCLWLWAKGFRKSIIMSLLGIGLLSGGYYGRNIFIYGQPFVTSVDFEPFKIQQELIPRNLYWWVNPTPLLNMDLYRAHWQSFGVGTYFSFFYDGHNNLIPVQEKSLAGNLLILLSLIFLAVALTGLVAQIRKKDRVAFYLTGYSLLLIMAYALYNLKLPYFSTVKGVFVSSLVWPLIYGVGAWLKQHPRFFNLALAALVAWTGLIFKNFWILNGWYK